MKFLCDRCKTRYSIGDDRVRGKILKIRCKNCANVITVREGMSDDGADAPQHAGPRSSKATTAAPPATVTTPAAPTNGAKPNALGAAFASAMSNPAMKPPPALEEEWYVSLDGDQEGPYSLAEAQRWVAGRAFDAELHCWSEGFDDWLPVDKVSHFRGLRKKPVAVAPPPLPRIGGGSGGARAMSAAPATAPIEDEPKPLFAATMASLEKAAMPPGVPTNGNNGSYAQNKLGLPPRATPAGGVPAVAKGNGSSGALGARTPVPVATKATPSAAVRAPVRPAISGFDLEVGDSATMIDAPPFADDQRTAAEPVASQARASGFDPVPTTPMGPPMGQTPMGPAGRPMFPETIKPNTPFGAPPVAPIHNDAGDGDGGDDDEGDLDIGEVSRVVNLADIARGPSKRARTNPGAAGRSPGMVGRTSGPAIAIANANATGAVGRIDMQTGMPIAPLAPGIDPSTLSPLDPNYVPDAALAPQAVTPTTSHRRMYIMLGVAAVLLAAIVVVVVVVTSQPVDPTQIGLRTGPDYSTERPEDRARRQNDPNPLGSNKEPTGSAKVVPKNNGNYVRPNIPNTPFDGGGGSKLSPEDIALASSKYEGLTAACWRQIDKGVDLEIFRDLKKVLVTIKVSGDGVVTGVTVSNHDGDKIGNCLKRTMGSWKLPTGKAGDYSIILVRPPS